MRVLQGRYRLGETLGEGGMGKVFRAEALHLGRTFAVKQLKGPHPDDPSYPSYLKSFRAEAQLLAGLHHPRLPRVVDFFEEDGEHFLVMDLVEGKDLGQLLETRHPAEEVTRWALQVLDVLDYLHTRTPPIVVRDLKPSNLILTPQGLTLVDFGIARVLAPATKTATLAAGMGTPGYAPPEQYASGQSDPRSDLYALGATLYHLVTGQEPVESVRLAAGLATQPPPDAPEPLRSVIVRAMTPRLDDRYPSAAAMRAALTESGAASDARAQAADARPPASGSWLTHLRQRFQQLGWRLRDEDGFDLALDGPGLVAPLLLVKTLKGEPQEADFLEQARALKAPQRMATVYLVLAAQRFPNPVTIQNEAKGLSRLGMLKRLLVLPLDLSSKKLLDRHAPRNDNDLNDPVLNLAAAVGSHR